ncbi:acyltransferase family protein [Timonella sp. A28]|uniref:acyltransferase family protein n=1 Tax=Timonella sp. A28 TaxID=3442640 RepID=UPI003EBFC994
METQKHLYRLDALKFISAIMVVAIHASSYLYHTKTATVLNYEWYRYFLEFAVPFFFAASGLLLQNSSPKKIISFSIKVFSLYIAASILYTVFNISKIAGNRYFLDIAFWDSLRNLLSKWTVGAFIRGDFAQFHLWYLMAATLAGLIIAFLRSKGFSTQKIFIMSTLLYIAHLSSFIDFNPIVAHGGFPRALFYTSLGMLAGKFLQKNYRFYGIISISAITAYAAPRILDSGNLIDIFLIISVFAAISWAGNSNAQPNFISYMGKYALTIYILHMAFITAINQTILYAGYDLDYLRTHAYWVPAMITASVLLSILMHKPFERLFLKPVTRIIDSLTPDPATSDLPAVTSHQLSLQQKHRLEQRS